MVSKEGGKCMLTNSESDSEAAPSLALVEKYSLDASRQVRKRNKALQVRFKDICEAQNEQREAALQAAAASGGKPVAYKAAYRKYMTVPARRSIPNVTRSTGVQTSPDLKKRYQTFPFERKKGHGHAVKHAASYKDQNNGFLLDGRQQEEEEEEEEGTGGAAGGGGRVQRTRALLHTSERGAAGAGADSTRSDAAATPLGCELADPDRLSGAAASQADYQLCSVRPRPARGLQRRGQEVEPEPERARDAERSSAKRHLLRPEDEEEDGRSRTRPDRTSGVTGPISWNSLTQVECPDSPAAATRGKRKKGAQLNGLQSQTLPRAASCTTQAQCHAGPFSPPQRRQRPLRAAEEEEGGVRGACGDAEAGAGAPGGGGQGGEACRQMVPVTQEGDVKAQLQAMESLISSSQETIKVLLGVIQELEKGEAHREGLSYRTGQDTANCDTCRNSACIIYSVELDFKQQEDKLQPLMKRLYPTEDGHFSSLPYPQEAFTSTPKRKSKAESKKHARWKLWFL